MQKNTAFAKWRFSAAELCTHIGFPFLMRLSVCCCSIILITAQLLLAKTGNSQNIKDETITIDIRQSEHDVGVQPHADQRTHRAPPGSAPPGSAGAGSRTPRTR